MNEKIKEHKCNKCRWECDKYLECVNLASEFQTFKIEDIPTCGCGQFFSEIDTDNFKNDDEDTRELL